MTTWKSAGILVGILIIATFLRTYHLSELPPGLYPDEAMNGSNAFEALSTGQFKVYYPENNGREGLFMNIQAYFLKFLMAATGSAPEPWMLRLPSAIFGILTVLGLYFLGKELTSRRVGLLASFFLATSFWHLMFSRIGFRAIMAPFFMIWAAYFLLAAVRRGAGGGAVWLPKALAGGIFFGLGFYSYIAYRVAPLIFLVFVLFFRKDFNFWKIVAVFVGITFVVALPIGWYYLQNPVDFLGRTSQVSVFSSTAPLRDLSWNIIETLGMFNFVGDWNARHNYPGQPEVFLPVGLLFIIGLGLIVRNLRKTPAAEETPLIARDRRFAASFMGTWFLFMFLPVVISNEGLPHALRALLLIPPVFFFAALGGDWLIKRMAGKYSPKIIAAGVSLMAVILVAEISYSYFFRWADHRDTKGAFAADYVEMGRAIRALPNETPKYVVVEAGGVMVRGIPMPAQTVMFMTDSFTPDKQAAKNIHYLLPGETDRIPENAAVFHIR